MTSSKLFRQTYQKLWWSFSNYLTSWCPSRKTGSRHCISSVYWFRVSLVPILSFCLLQQMSVNCTFFPGIWFWSKLGRSSIGFSRSEIHYNSFSYQYSRDVARQVHGKFNKISIQVFLKFSSSSLPLLLVLSMDNIELELCWKTKNDGHRNGRLEI